MKIKPIEVIDGEEFDGLDEIYYENHSSGGGKRKNGGKVIPTLDDGEEKTQRRKKSTQKPANHANKDKATIYSSSKSSINQLEYLNIAKSYLCSRRSWLEGVPFLLVGFLLSCLLENLGCTQLHNVAAMIVLAASIKSDILPRNSVRTHLCVSVCVLSTYCLDGVYIHSLTLRHNTHNPITHTAQDTTLYTPIIAVYSLLLFFKSIYLYAYLYTIPQARRIRRYLWRRIRLFVPLCIVPGVIKHSYLSACLPAWCGQVANQLSQPRRLMRDARGRMVALVYIHTSLLLTYFICTLVYRYYFDIPLELPSQLTSNLVFFLVVKLLCTAVLLGGMLYDTNIYLALWEFGCLAFQVKCIRKYIHAVRVKYQGYPLVYSFYVVRFYMVCAAKMLDMAWGAYGVGLLAGTVGGRAYTPLDEGLQTLLSCICIALFVDVVYCPLLLCGVWRLAYTHSLLLTYLQGERDIESDDSELDDFHLRCVELDEQVRREREKAERLALLTKQDDIEEAMEEDIAEIKLVDSNKIAEEKVEETVKLDIHRPPEFVQAKKRSLRGDRKARRKKKEVEFGFGNIGNENMDEDTLALLAEGFRGEQAGVNAYQPNIFGPSPWDDESSGTSSSDESKMEGFYTRQLRRKKNTSEP